MEQQEKNTFPAQHPNRQPDRKAQMNPAPVYYPAYKLAGKQALITGGDDGIGGTVAVAFAYSPAPVYLFNSSGQVNSGTIVN